MSLFSFGSDKKEKDTASKENDVKKKAQPEAGHSKDEEKKQTRTDPRFATNKQEVLLRPLFTEKAVAMEAERKYVFVVDPRANKPEVRKAVEQAYNVTVEKVAIINERSKLRRWRGRVGTTPGMKKAIVTLQEGQSIEIVSH